MDLNLRVGVWLLSGSLRKNRLKSSNAIFEGFPTQRAFSCTNNFVIF